MNVPKKKLQHLASRLEQMGGSELAAAAALVADAIAVDEMHPDVEHALFNELWQHVSRALDHEDFALSYLDEVNSLESEMAGHVLSHRLARGWLVRAAGAPTEFPRFSVVINESREREG